MEVPPQQTGFFLGKCGGMGPSEVAREQQTALWQQNSYLAHGSIRSGTDSGIQSVGPLSTVGGTGTDDDVFCDWDGQSSTGDFRGSSSASNYGVGGSTVAEAANGTLEDKIIPPSQTGVQGGRPVDFVPSFEEGMDILSAPCGPTEATTVQRHPDSWRMARSSVDSLKEHQGDVDIAKSIPHLANLLNDEDHVVVAQAAAMVHQLSKQDAYRHAIQNSSQMMRSLVNVMVTSNDPETMRSATGTLQNLSQHRQGLSSIFTFGGIPALVRLLASPVEGVLFYAITTLHNLLLHQDGSKAVVQRAGGLQQLVCLLQRTNMKFLAVVTDCLQILAYGNPEAKLTILASGGPTALIRILESCDYDKLLLTTTRVLKVLSVCSSNKPAIINANGLHALTKHLKHSSQHVVLNCLWTIRNLSDALLRQDNVESLLQNLIALLGSPKKDVVTCAAGILSNLTCNNQRNKSLVYTMRGCQALVHAIINANDRQEIIEPAVCALRHLTCRHPEAELAQQVLRGSYGLFVKLLQPPYTWPVVKAVIGFIRNLASYSENHADLHKNGTIERLVCLLRKAFGDMTASRINGGSVPQWDGVTMADIVEAVSGTLHLFVKESRNRSVLYSMHVTPVFVQLLYSDIENIQRVAASFLCEFASDREGANQIDADGATVLLNELMICRHDVASRYASEILSRISDSKRKGDYGKPSVANGDRPTSQNFVENPNPTDIENAMDIEIDFYTNPSQVYPPNTTNEVFQDPTHHQQQYGGNNSDNYIVRGAWGS